MQVGSKAVKLNKCMCALLRTAALLKVPKWLSHGMQGQEKALLRSWRPLACLSVSSVNGNPRLRPAHKLAQPQAHEA